MSELITRADIVAGRQYTPAPGTRYEIAEGIIATMKPDTFETIEAFDSVKVKNEDGSDRDIFGVALDRMRAVVNAPAGFDGWKQVSAKVAWRIVGDFLHCVTPQTEPPKTSSPA